MAGWMYKILMLVAVATVIGHNSMPHYHHEMIEALAHLDDDHHAPHQHTNSHADEQDNTNDHSIFSFAQLDDDFLPSKFSKINFELPILYVLTPAITYHFNRCNEQSKTHFGYYVEFPPPLPYSSGDLRRGPPPLVA
jgi:hypothetical protein